MDYRIINIAAGKFLDDKFTQIDNALAHANKLGEGYAIYKYTKRRGLELVAFWSSIKCAYHHKGA